MGETTMKKAIVTALLCINIALGAALVLSSTPRATGQAVFRQTDYLAATGVIERDYDALWVIDLAKQRMAAFKLDRARRKMVGSKGRRLANDFQERSGK
jgi:hypothetical protein